MIIRMMNVNPIYIILSLYKYMQSNKYVIPISRAHHKLTHTQCCIAVFAMRYRFNFLSYALRCVSQMCVCVCALFMEFTIYQLMEINSIMNH